MMTNPNGVSYAVAYEGMFCSNEEHVAGCPCQAGGDPEYRCYYCGRDVSDDDYVMVSLPNSMSTARCCSTCWDRGVEYVSVGLDYTEDEPDFNVEGQPEFNGAFR